MELKPTNRITIPLSICLLSTTLLLFITPLTLPQLHSLLLPACPHIVLITAARHGSSWFLNSAEHCPATTSFDALNKASELWNRAQKGPVMTLTPPQAADYVQHTHGVKIFPLVYYANDTLLRAFFDVISGRDIPVFVLTRAVEDSFKSFRDAVESNEWNVNYGEKVAVNDSGLVDRDELLGYQRRLENYFNAVRESLLKKGIEWDEFEYDDVVGRRVIVGYKNRCIIRNCNY